MKQEQTLMQTINSVATKVKAELNKQQNERRQTEDTLLRLLEETCNKLQQINDEI